MKSPIQRQLELFSAALEHPAGPERDAFLAKECAGDDALLDCVRALLASHSQAGSFIAQPAGPISPTGTHLLPSTEKPGDKIGRYKLLQQIGEGGCGTVYMAEQEEPVRRRVALKVIRLGMDTKSVVARFEAERQALALMDHPNIAKIYDGGDTASPRPSDGRGAGGEGHLPPDACPPTSAPGRPYFVMELVRGIKITEYCDQAHLSTEERLKLFIQVCQAVQHAHQKGIIHRDIKPSNILVTVNDGVAVPKVIDFGIAKATDQRLTDKSYFTEFHAFIGTPAYTSPEQAEMSSLDIDTRSDIYSLGVLLYEMLTGQTPFPAERLLQSGLDEMRRIIREEEPPRPSTRLTTLGLAEATELSQKRQAKIPQLASAVQGDLDWIVMKALEKDRTRRYATTLDLAADLQRHLNSEAVLARPPSLAYRLQRTVRRHKGMFAAAAAIMITLIAGLGASMRFLLLEKQARRAAMAAEQQQRSLHAIAQEERARAEREKLAALSQRERADVQAQIARETAERLKLQKAEDLFKANNTSLALGVLGQVLRENPSNRVAAERIMSALSHRNFMAPLFLLPKALVTEFSPAGRRLAVVDHNGLNVFNAQSGQLEFGPTPLLHFVENLCFSADGTQLLLQGTNHVSLWNMLGLVKLKEFPASADPILSADFTPPGPRVVTVAPSLSSAYSLSVFDLDGTQLLGPLLHPWIQMVVFTRDGTKFVAASRNSDLRIWDAVTGVPLTEIFRGGGSHASVAFDPDGKNLALGSFGSRSAYVFDVANPKRNRRLLSSRAITRCVAFSSDGRLIATGDDDRTARIWDAASGKLITDALHSERSIVDVRFDPSGKYLATASDDRTVRVWDCATGKSVRELTRCDARIKGLRFSPDGVSLLILTSTEAQAWDLRPGQTMAEIVPGTNQLQSSAISPDGTLEVRLGGEYNGGATYVEFFDARTKTPVSKPIGFEANVWEVTFSPDSQRVVLGIGLVNGKARGRAEIFDRTGERLMDLPVDGWAALSVDYSQDGQRIATGSKWQHARVWDAQTGRPITAPLDHEAEVGHVSFSPDGRKLLTVGGPIARVWDCDSGQQLYSLRHEGDIHAGRWSWSPDGALLATSGTEGVCRVWRVENGMLVYDLRHPASVLYATFSPDGNRLATGSGDGVVRLWDAYFGQELSEPLRASPLFKTESVSSVKFVEGGKRLLVSIESSRYADAPWLIQDVLGGDYLWEVPTAFLPIPWLPDLAEAIGGQRLGDRMQGERVPSTNLFRLKREILARTENTIVEQWAKWFFADRLTRPVSSQANLATLGHVKRAVELRDSPFDWEACEDLVRSDSNLVQQVVSARDRLLDAQRAAELDTRANNLWRDNKELEAESPYRESIAIRKRIYGQTNILVAKTLSDLAELLGVSLNRPAEAEIYHREALAIYRVLWPEYPLVRSQFEDLARFLQGQGRLAEAEAALREGFELDSLVTDATGRWANISQRLIDELISVLRQQNKTAELKALFSKIAEHAGAKLLNSLAWDLATSSEMEQRDGQHAMLLAETAVRLANRKDEYFLDTLAAAYAEAGRFDNAIQTQKEALAQLKPSADKSAFLHRLKLYESKTAYRYSE